MPEHSIGIDVGKKDLAACIRSSDGLTNQPASFPNSSIGLKKFLSYLSKAGVAADVPILLESTGPYHWLAATTLTKAGRLAKVVNPLHTKQILRYSIRKRKTDKVDAGHLAFLASQGYGYEFVDTDELASKKALVRHFWKLRATATNHLVHERYLKEFRGISRFSISPLILKKCEALKKEIVQEFSKGNDLKYVDSIPGITPFLGACLLAELQPLSRFRRVEQLIAYAGLDPSVKQTGTKQPAHGQLSKRGSPTLRQLLFLAAFGSFSKKPMNQIYQRYKDRGMHHNAIMCILSRKILRIAYALLTKREVFKEQYLDRT